MGGALPLKTLGSYAKKAKKKKNASFRRVQRVGAAHTCPLCSDGLLESSAGRLIGFLVGEAPAGLPRPPTTAGRKIRRACRILRSGATRVGVLQERRRLKEAAQAERQTEGLSGGRCSMTNLTTPHLFLDSSSLHKLVR